MGDGAGRRAGVGGIIVMMKQKKGRRRDDPGWQARARHKCHGSGHFFHNSSCDVENDGRFFSHRRFKDNNIVKLEEDR